jgi:addiction module HigA family antidote
MLTITTSRGAVTLVSKRIEMDYHSLARERRKGPILGNAQIGIGPSNAILAPMRDASCRASPSLTEHRRDMAPPIQAPQPDLASGHETEEEHERPGIGRDNTALASTISGGCAFAGRKVTPRMSRSSTITKPSARGRGRRPSPVSPGEILQEEFLRPLGISQYRLAKALTVPPRRINEIVHGKRAVTADTALRLARHFGTSERFWLNLQARYDLEIEKDRLGDRLRREVQVLVPAG